jgi:hypothetical protein
MPQGKGGGRRVREAGRPLTKNLTFRLDAELDKQLRRAAERAGRSVSEEVQYRLRESFKLRSAFHLRRDYLAVAASYRFILAQGEILKREHPELAPMYQEVADNWAAIEGEERD